ncbi:10239_t:CDS:2, partial [Gigaspora rosea]
ACIKILELDSKKDFNAKVAAIDFRTKKISIANIRPETLTEIQKFPIPIQKLIAEEAHAVSRRLQEGKKYKQHTLVLLALTSDDNFLHDHDLGTFKGCLGAGRMLNLTVRTTWRYLCFNESRGVRDGCRRIY